MYDLKVPLVPVEYKRLLNYSLPAYDQVLRGEWLSAFPSHCRQLQQQLPDNFPVDLQVKQVSLQMRQNDHILVNDEGHVGNPTGCVQQMFRQQTDNRKSAL